MDLDLEEELEGVVVQEIYCLASHVEVEEGLVDLLVELEGARSSLVDPWDEEARALATCAWLFLLRVGGGIARGLGA